MSDQAVNTVTAVAAGIAAIGGLSALANVLYRVFFGGPERAANTAVALTGAAKLMVDELQEEVHAARDETRQARAETHALRAEINELRELTSKELARLRAENHSLRQLNGSLRAQLGKG